MNRLLCLVLGLGAVTASWSLSISELQDLIDQAPRGQTVILPPGTYQGNLVVRNPIVLLAQPGAKLVRSPGTTGPTLWIASSEVTVRGLEIEGTGEGTRRDRTALMVTGSRVTLTDLTIRKAWSGLWVDQAADITVSGLTVTGLVRLPFWERGEGVRITNGTNLRLTRLRVRSTADGVYAERTVGLVFQDCQVTDVRYGVHGMFSSEGTVDGLSTSRAVVGVMLMESSRWVVSGSRLTDGYRTGSAGVRQIRTKDVTVEGNEITRQASGVELIDVREGRFRGNQITQNGTAWTWGRDNTGTTVENNVHRGNLQDFAGDEPSEEKLQGPDPQHQSMVPPPDPAPTEKVTVPTTALHVRPVFDRNVWDGWSGTDLDQDGIGDTPYRFDREAAVRAAARPWAGIFLGSPWTQWSRGLPGGEVLDAHPRTRLHPEPP